MRKAIRIFDAVLYCIISVIMSLIVAGNIALPSDVIMTDKNKITYGHIFSLSADDVQLVASRTDSAVKGTDTDIKLLGAIPVKSVSLTHIDNNKVIVSGQSFGIKIYTDGVLVVGTKDITVGGVKMNPSKDCGIEVGDIIVSINNKEITSSTDVEDILTDNNGRNYRVKIKRDGIYKTFTLKPVYSQTDGCYKAGIWVRDSTAGIGTITFYNPANSTIAALGHPITDVDTGEIMPILKGEAVTAKVTKIYKSTSGSAGSICCDFSNKSIGSLTDNTDYGIYGKYDCTDIPTTIYQVAKASEVEKGDCQILTTVSDGEPKLYSAKITHISYRDNSDDQKNMIVKVTDKNLLKITGGIVQGMSGSPIIQNGRLVGALTHVIVDRPDKGYAIFAESMLKESEKLK